MKRLWINNLKREIHFENLNSIWEKSYISGKIIVIQGFNWILKEIYCKLVMQICVMEQIDRH